MAVLTVNAPELSKALTNAEAWLPAKSAVPVALVVASYDGLTITVTDHYTAGESKCPAVEYRGSDEAVQIRREDLVALAARARKDGTKKVLSRVTVETDRGVIVHGAIEDERAEVVTALAVPGPFREEWTVLADMFATAASDAAPFPDRVMVAPAYLAMFNKVRPDASGRGVDLLTCPINGAIFGKVGPNFRGLVMVLDSGKNEAALGEGGLW
ncbi:hypothetical protein GCM10010466_29180 [Planomonospora alba]|uniref:Uncharacterized protein n=1 Tax=Planomonospora alba TaxID=161354 RepID=A0ABP6N4T9_9ACTN